MPCPESIIYLNSTFKCSKRKKVTMISTFLLGGRILCLVFFWVPTVTRGEGNGNPLQYSCLENPMDRGAWVAKSQAWLSDFTFTFHFHALEKEKATQSSVLVWRIPGMGEPGGLPSLGSHRVGHNWSDLAAVAAATVTRRTSLYFKSWPCASLPNSSFNGLTLELWNQPKWKFLEN